MSDKVRHEREIRELWQLDHERVHDREREAIDKAQASVGQRLEGMNEMRGQIDRERGNYITRETFESNNSQTDGRLKLLEKSGSFDAGRIAMLGTIGALLLALIGIAAHFWGK